MHRENIPMEGYTLTFDLALTSSFTNKPEELSLPFINQVRERVFAGEPDAEEILSKLIQAYPNFPLPYFFRAFLFLKLEQYQEGQEAIEEMNRLFPDYFWSGYLRAFWCLHEENYEGILRFWGQIYKS